MRLAKLGCIAIDSNLLLVLLGYHCLLLKPAHERGRLLAGIRGRAEGVPPQRFDALWRLFLSATRRIVTEHIVAETYGLRHRLNLPKEKIWVSAITLLTNPGIEEHSCSLSKLLEQDGYRRLIEEIGPSDSGLIYTAEREKATIISDDGTLAHWARVRSVTVLSLHLI